MAAPPQRNGDVAHVLSQPHRHEPATAPVRYSHRDWQARALVFGFARADRPVPCTAALRIASRTFPPTDESVSLSLRRDDGRATFSCRLLSDCLDEKSAHKVGAARRKPSPPPDHFTIDATVHTLVSYMSISNSTHSAVFRASEPQGARAEVGASCSSLRGRARLWIDCKMRLSFVWLHAVHV